MTPTRIPDQEQSWYVTPEHRLDMSKLLMAFQESVELIWADPARRRRIETTARQSGTVITQELE
jgi:hypothetical protein